ncbi:MAG TPA: ATP-binding protein [Methylomirabilota bacterium]|nr:ATP-binding protein [Methylomirabilota bacterium]
MGETRVDLLHLLEDLRDAYPGAAEETILTEVVANSLDSGATAITVTADPAGRTLTIVDDGRGMRRRDLARYHDVAATTKVRGEGIGFAGVGIKIGLLVSEEVLTETRMGRHHAGTAWHLASRHRAPWKWVPPPGLVAEHGTAVRLSLKNPLSPLLDPGFIEGALRRHFQPLLDPALTEIVADHYPRGAQLAVNGQPLEPWQCRYAWLGWRRVRRAAKAPKEMFVCAVPTAPEGGHVRVGVLCHASPQPTAPAHGHRPPPRRRRTPFVPATLHGSHLREHGC